MVEGNQPQTAVTWVYEHSKHTGNVYQVLRTLAIAYAEQGACLSVKEIAEQTRVSQTTARNALKLLERDGTIEVIKNGGTKRRNGVTNCYRLVGFQPGAQDAAPETRGTPSYSTTPSSTPTQRSSTTPSYIPSANPVNVPVYVSDAAGEKDLSGKEKAKEKDKNTTLPEKTGKERATAKPEKPPRERNLLFDAMVVHIFGVSLDDTRKVKALSGRIGALIKQFPAEPESLTPERIEQFAKWWHATRPTLNIPQGAASLASPWGDFEKIFKSRPPQPVDQTGRITPRLLDENTGMHKTISDEVLNRLRPSWKVGAAR